MPTTRADHDALERLAAERGLPAPPVRPGPGVCCERDCDPCILDYYERAVTRWCERHGVARPRRVEVVDVAELK